jgi:tryptophan synthase alpha chain
MERLKQVAAYSSGFVYLVSRTGVTGVRDQLAGSAADLVERMRTVTDLPLAVGFGIAKAADAAAVAKIADGVVVGSAFVRIIEDSAGSLELESRLETFTRELKVGAKAGRA